MRFRIQKIIEFNSWPKIQMQFESSYNEYENMRESQIKFVEKS